MAHQVEGSSNPVELSPSKTKQVLKRTDEIDGTAKVLLDNKLILSALELHTELIEAGISLPRLKDFFSNPNNFEVQSKLEPVVFVKKAVSVLTLDSIDDFAQYSDDGLHEADERLAVLEFELRKSKETIHELRQTITEMTSDKNVKDKTEDDSKDDEINQFERRAINFLLNEYLMKYDHKLTAITFADEIGDQDLDDWEDVGLNTSQPPDLLMLFRDYLSHVVDPVNLRANEINDLHSEVDLLTARCDELSQQLSQQKQVNEKLLADLRERPYSLNSDYKHKKHKLTHSRSLSSPEDIKKEIELLTNKIDDNSRVSSEPIAIKEEEENIESNKNIDFKNIDNEIKNKNSENITTILNETELEINKKDEFESLNTEIKLTSEEVSKLQRAIVKVEERQVPSSFVGTLIRLVNGENTIKSELSKQVSYSTGSTPVEVIANTLPNIVPNVLLNKREELIPLILCAARFHEETRQRDELLHMLFNLIKRPQPEQRRIIIDGFVEFACNVEATRIESELLPQCWEQINHKFSERRLLVSESCGAISPYLPVELQSSLIFSMLSQMLQDDRSEVVRESTVKSLAVLVNSISNLSKYNQVCSLFEYGLLDIVDEVVVATKQTLLPALAVWSAEVHRLQSHFVAQLFARCKTALQSWQDAHFKESSSESLDAEKKFTSHADCLVKLVIHLFAYCLQQGPFDKDIQKAGLAEGRLTSAENKLFSLETIMGQEADSLVLQFDENFSGKEPEAWPSLDWVIEQCLPDVCELTGLMFYNSGFINKLVEFISTVCKTFGRPFTNSKIIPYFEKVMRETDASYLNDNAPICTPLLTVFLCGVLAVFKEAEQASRLCMFIKQCFLTIATQDFSDQYLSLSLDIILSEGYFHIPMLDMARELVVYPVPQVRTATLILVEVLARTTNKDTLTNSVAPVLITLTNDRDVNVRIASTMVLATVVERSPDKQLLEKISSEIQNLLEDKNLQGNSHFLKTIVLTITKMIPKAEFKFRDEALIPRLKWIGELTQQMEDLTDRLEVYEALIASQNAALCCYLTKEVMLNFILPTLQLLEDELKNVAPETLDSVLIMIKDTQAKCGDALPRTSSNASSLFGNLSSRFKKKGKP